VIVPGTEGAYHVHAAINPEKDTKQDRDTSKAMEGARERAQSLRQRAQAAADMVRSALSQAAAACGGTMAGVDKQIKEEDSLTKKIFDRACQGGEPTDARLDKEASKINDALRYTAVLGVNRYMEAHRSIRAALAGAGMQYVKEGNAWAEPERFGHTYRGINMTFKTADGLMFELQLHTKESLGVKEKWHAEYKEMQDPATSQERRDQLRSQIRGYVEGLPVPTGADVKPPRPPGRGRR
jgi:hypothetical protein